VSFLTPIIIGLKRRMKISDINSLLSLMTGYDVQTERELPPLMLSSDFWLGTKTRSEKVFFLEF
jgi:hypothetical protein